MSARTAKALAALGLLVVAAPALAQTYHTYSEIGEFLDGVAVDHPDIARLYDLGLSEESRHIWGLQITDNPDVEEDEPEFRYIAAMHGDEWVGIEMCLYFIDLLTDDYGSDPNLAELVDEIDIWIVPLMNPDGHVRTQRNNANGVNLNRDFPDPYTSPNNTTVGRAAETAVIMNWSFASSFMLSANMHGGALVVNYPFDNNPEGASVYTPTPDDDLFIWISEEYSQHNLPMWNSSSFHHGITNGAAWYAISGGMQDWNYHYMGSNEVTLELSNTKIPPASQIPTFWDQNRDSMLAYMATCLTGVRGIVTDADTGVPLAATVTVDGRDHEIYTDPDVGDYHRMLLPGTYDLLFEVAGYDPLPIMSVVVSSGSATRLDVALPAELPQITAPNGGETLTVGVPTDVTWTGRAIDRFHAQYTDHYGNIAVISDGFERSSLGSDYATGGNTSWYITTSDQHSGVRSVRAGNIDDNQISWMTRTADGGGDLSFWYRVSSEANYDFFNFYIDGNRKVHASGAGSWQLYSTTLSAGTHELKWEYVKDGYVSSGSDTVWVDDLEVTSDSTVWTDIVALTDPGVTSISWEPPVPGDQYKVRVRAAYDAGYSAWDESDAVFSVEAAPELIGDLNGDCAVDIADLAELLAHYGACTGEPEYLEAADLDSSGCVNLADLAELLAHYGETCP